MNHSLSSSHPAAAGPQPAAAEAPSGSCRLWSHCTRRGAAWTLASLLALACVVLIAACGGDAASPGDDAPGSLAASAGHEVSVRPGTDDPEWAPGEMPTASTPDASTTMATAAPLRKPTSEPIREQIRELWTADGRARITLPEDRPLDPALHWSGQRYATRAQLAHEELTNAPLTLVIDADDEAALDTAMQLGERLATYGSDKSLLGVFVRSRTPALAARLAERLSAEQGWVNVFVVI